MRTIPKPGPEPPTAGAPPLITPGGELIAEPSLRQNPRGGGGQKRRSAHAKALADAGVVVPRQWLKLRPSQAAAAAGTEVAQLAENDRPRKRHKSDVAEPEPIALAPEAQEEVGPTTDGVGVARACDSPHGRCWHCTRPFLLRPRDSTVIRNRHVVNGVVRMICKSCYSHTVSYGDPDLVTLHCSVCGRKDMPYRSGIRPKVCIGCTPTHKQQVDVGPKTCWHCTRTFRFLPDGSLLRHDHEVDGVVHKICQSCDDHKRSHGGADLGERRCSVCGSKGAKFKHGREPLVCMHCYREQKREQDGEATNCWHCARPFRILPNGGLARKNHEVNGVVHKICQSCADHKKTHGPSLEGCRCSVCGRKDLKYKTRPGAKVCVECFRGHQEEKPSGPVMCWHCTRPFAVQPDGSLLRHNHEVDGVVHKICPSCDDHKRSHGDLAKCRCSVCGRADVSYRPYSGQQKVCVECTPPVLSVPRKERGGSTACWHCARTFKRHPSNGSLLRFNCEVDGVLHKVCHSCINHQRVHGNLKERHCSKCGRKDLAYQRQSATGLKVCVDCFANKEVMGSGHSTCWHCNLPFTAKPNGSLRRFNHKMVEGAVHQICATCNRHKRKRNDPYLLSCVCSVCGRKDVPYRTGCTPKVCVECTPQSKRK